MKTTFLPLIFIAVAAGCTADSVSNKSTGGMPGRSVSKFFAPSPAAPIDLSYQVASSVVAGQPVPLAVTLHTGLESGDLQLKVTKQIGIALIGDAVRHVDLATAKRPIELTLTVIPSDQVQRSLVVVVTVEVGGELQSRSFRLSLPENNPSTQ